MFVDKFKIALNYGEFMIELSKALGILATSSVAEDRKVIIRLEKVAQTDINRIRGTRKPIHAGRNWTIQFTTGKKKTNHKNHCLCWADVQRGFLLDHDLVQTQFSDRSYSGWVRNGWGSK